MSLTAIQMERFTAFEKLKVNCSPGLNVFVGGNGTGKTHLMKTAYAACDITKSEVGFAEKLIRVFMPSNRALGRLVKRQKGSARGAAEVYRSQQKLRVSFSNHTTVPESATVTGAKMWRAKPIQSVYIPVKEMLSNAPGFRSLYAQREIHFEEVYADIVDRAYRPPLRGPIDHDRRTLLHVLQQHMEGKVTIKNDEFFLRSQQGNLEFPLLAEGIRKLGLLWLLIQNGTLLGGSVLFWDEPETNLNPRLFGALMEILLKLQRGGVQVFLATHDYVVLKELDLQRTQEDEITFHALYREEDTKELACHSVTAYSEIHPNAIAQTFSDLYDREVNRSLGSARR